MTQFNIDLTYIFGLVIKCKYDSLKFFRSY